MKTILLITLASLSSLAFSQEAEVSTPILTTESEVESKDFVHRKSHWMASFGFDRMDYPVPFTFRGEEETFSPEKEQLYGGRIGLGREFNLGAGFMTTSMLEGFFVGTLFETAINAAPEEEDEEISFTKKTGHVYGAEFVQSFGYLFNVKTKNPFMDVMTHLVLEPFVEVGIGKAWAYNRRNYNYDTGAANTQESYRLRVTDDILSQRIGLGIRLTSNQGYFMYLKATQHNYDVTKRKMEGFSQPDGQARTPIEETSSNVDLDPVMVYSLGGGYKW